MNFKELIQLCEGDNSKIFVVNEAGDVKLVVMNAVDFEGLLVQKLADQNKDIETINQEIVQAQLKEETIPASAVANPRRQANGLFPSQDLRSEVIDPTFDFDSPEEVEIDGL
jgi:hypothetical protein